MLSPGSYGANRLREIIGSGGLAVWFLDETSLQRAFALMEQYADHPMDLADASLIVAAEALFISKVFTIFGEVTATMERISLHKRGAVRRRRRSKGFGSERERVYNAPDVGIVDSASEG